ncbi:hypothetical protein M6B38_204790 [Iris pallida]|uniref:Uncharacterized protein n=1 Tax=Iris pallida TaxID=29817 RepID=A0AAX6E862_IRIPA|nr:hypothetical protein M6B38_204790 [Iris pallida]
MEDVASPDAKPLLDSIGRWSMAHESAHRWHCGAGDAWGAAVLIAGQAMLASGRARRDDHEIGRHRDGYRVGWTSEGDDVGFQSAWLGMSVCLRRWWKTQSRLDNKS